LDFSEKRTKKKNAQENAENPVSRGVDDQL
jgi:hypothetical protein